MQRLRMRRHLSAAQRNDVIAAYRKSNITQRQFAERTGIGLSTLGRWLRQAPSIEPAPEFVSVPNLLAVPTVKPPYRLQWPQGLSLEIASGFDREELVALLQLLPRS